MSKVALVTGGTRGIGAAISIGLKNAGYTVAANYGGNDAAAQAHSLLAWAQTERPGLVNLGALAAALASAPQREAIATLQKRLYATDGAAPSGEALAAAFRDGFQWHAAAPPPADPSGLPPLYPFKLD